MLVPGDRDAEHDDGAGRADEQSDAVRAAQVGVCREVPLLSRGAYTEAVADAADVRRVQVSVGCG